MRILITGGCGFLGSNLAASFLSKDYEVFIIDSMERLGSENNLNWLKSIDLKDKLIFHKINIVNTEKVQLLFQDYQLISHYFLRYEFSEDLSRAVAYLVLCFQVFDHHILTPLYPCEANI